MGLRIELSYLKYCYLTHFRRLIRERRGMTLCSGRLQGHWMYSVLGFRTTVICSYRTLQQLICHDAAKFELTYLFKFLFRAILLVVALVTTDGAIQLPSIDHMAASRPLVINDQYHFSPRRKCWQLFMALSERSTPSNRL